MLLSAVLQPYGGAYSSWGLEESHLIPPSSQIGREGFSFPGLVPPNDMINSKSVVGTKPGDSSVVIGYQLDELNDIW